MGFFLGLYNTGHVALRVWGLETGWRRGMRVATALGNPVFRQGPQYVARAAALIGGLAVPLALQRIIGPGRALLGAVLVGAALGAFLLAKLQGRAEGWRVALGVLAAFVLYSVAR